MPDDRQQISIALDAGMVSNVGNVLSERPLRAENVRYSGLPKGSVGAGAQLQSFTLAARDTGGVCLIPYRGEVAVGTKSGIERHHSRAGSFSRAKSINSTARDAQTWCPLTVPYAGVAYAGGDSESVRNAESAVLTETGYPPVVITAVTVFRTSGAGAANGTLRCLLRIQDAATGAVLLEDTELASAVRVFGGTNDGAVVLGALPNGTVWWGEFDDASTVWTIKFRKVTYQPSTDTLTVGTAQTVYATTKVDAVCAVTHAIEPASPTYVYIARNRDSDDRFEIVKWDTETNSALWTTASSTVAETVYTPASGVGIGTGCGLAGPIDVCAANGYVAMVARTAATLGRAVGILTLSQASGTESGSKSAVALPNSGAAGVIYEHVGITAVQIDGVGDEWLVVGTVEDVSGGLIGNQTPTNFTTQRRTVMSRIGNSAAVLVTESDTWFASASLRPFSAYDTSLDGANAAGPGRYAPFVPMTRAPREYDATDNVNGYAGYPGYVLSTGTTLALDAAIELCTWNHTHAAAADGQRLHPVCRLGVDRFVPPISQAQIFFCSRYAKPLFNGALASVAYPSDRHSTIDAAKNVRWAVVSTEGVPPTAEAADGITYVGGGGLFTWDGEHLLEATPLSLPRIRLESGAADALGLVDGTYYLSAIYVFQDGAGNTHRSSPALATVSITLTGGPRFLEVYVEVPISMRDGRALRIIGVELYGSATTATSLTLLTDAVTGQPLQPQDVTNGEYHWQLYTTPFSASAAAAWWQGGQSREVRPDPLPAVHDMAIISDRMWVIGAEDRTVRYSKPHVEGRVFEFSATQEISFRSEAKPVAIAELDGRPIIFTDRDAWTVYGDGPNANGAGGQFSLPQRILRVGAAERRLVLATPLGVVFKSAGDQWFIVGSGSQLSPWGDEVTDALNGYDTAARPAKALVQREDAGEIWVLRGDGDGNSGESLVWNYEVQKWSVSSQTLSHDLVATRSAMYSLAGHGEANCTVLYDAQAHNASAITTHWVKPAGIEGAAGVYELIYTGRRLAAHDLSIVIYRDYDESSSQAESWTEAQITAAAVGGHVTVRAKLDEPHARAFRFVVSTTNAENWEPSSLTLMARARSGAQRRSSGDR